MKGNVKKTDEQEGKEERVEKRESYDERTKEVAETRGKHFVDHASDVEEVGEKSRRIVVMVGMEGKVGTANAKFFNTIVEGMTNLDQKWTERGRVKPNNEHTPRRWCRNTTSNAKTMENIEKAVTGHTKVLNGCRRFVAREYSIPMWPLSGVS